MSILTSIFGTHSDHEIKRIMPTVNKVLALDEEFKALSDEELVAMTGKLKERLEEGETLDDILPEAFATVREAASRVLGIKHYKVQIIGGIILHQGRIAEMKTGEGKT
ncbi:MAG: preprotein translocase subunit SecA, partial [Clostridiales bacterium]|nr:preprotein translocase subunit SecA [Clostridiales bacterium]